MASMTLGTSGSVVKGRAPDLPPAPEGADGAFMIDMIHFLSDDQLTLTLQRLHGRLAGGAPLTIRVVMMPNDATHGIGGLMGLETNSIVLKPIGALRSRFKHC